MSLQNLSVPPPAFAWMDGDAEADATARASVSTAVVTKDAATRIGALSLGARDASRTRVECTPFDRAAGGIARGPVRSARGRGAHPVPGVRDVVPRGRQHAAGKAAGAPSPR